MKTTINFTKEELINEVLLEVLKRKNKRLYTKRMPNVFEINDPKQVVYFDMKGTTTVSFDNILIKKEVTYKGMFMRVLFEDLNGNEFYVGSAYVKSYIKLPVWSKKHSVPKKWKGCEYNY